jgi:hypothetical protein
MVTSLGDADGEALGHILGSMGRLELGNVEGGAFGVF